MSNTVDSGPDAGIKEGLGKLASPKSESPPLTPTESPGSPTKREQAKKYSKRALLTVALLLVMVTGIVSGRLFSNASIRDMFWKIISHPEKTFRPGGWDLTGAYNLPDHFPPDKRKSLTVLILGVDHDYAGKRERGHVAVPVRVKNTPGRSDAIMVARFEFDGESVSSVNMLSIPRDARVRVPGHGIHKINAAYASGGPQLSMATIQDVFGITPDYYVDVNFEGFQQVVDAVGGVDIDVHQQLDYDDNWGNLHVHLKPGPQHLTGYKAMGYVRIRHSDDDLARAQRQHEFVEALRSRVTSPDTFMKLPDVVKSITDNLHSNLSMDQMLTLANLARKAPKDALCLDTLPVIEGRTYVYIDRRKSEAVIRKMFFKDKQVAVLNIKTPETEALPARHRKKRLHEPGSVPEVKHLSPEGSGVETGAGQESNNPPATESPGAPAPDRSDSADKQRDGAEKPPPSETPKSDGTASGDGSGASGNTKDGKGTSSGATSTLLKG
jgi:LCP family protein required for cell wall assembly